MPPLLRALVPSSPFLPLAGDGVLPLPQPQVLGDPPADLPLPPLPPPTESPLAWEEDAKALSLETAPLLDTPLY